MMFKTFFFLSILSLGLAQNSTWKNLRTTWGPVPGFRNAFDTQPRTETELDGWSQISSCDNPDPNFPGDRYVDEKDTDFVLIFDGNGFIAGIQHVIPLEKADQDLYDFEGSEFYVQSVYIGQDVYYTTAYFVDPSLICNGGRSQEEFDEQGTGTQLHFQTGPTPDSLLTAPLTVEEALADPAWYRHKCFANMGVHFMQLPYDENIDCRTVSPLQLIYNEGHLNAFVMHHVALLDGKRWEVPDGEALKFFVEVVPTCLNDLANQGMFTAMHNYVNEYVVSCSDNVEYIENLQN